jgi:hypothetical protein
MEKNNFCGFILKHDTCLEQSYSTISQYHYDKLIMKIIHNLDNNQYHVMYYYFSDNAGERAALSSDVCELMFNQILPLVQCSE